MTVREEGALGRNVKLPSVLNNRHGNSIVYSMYPFTNSDHAPPKYNSSVSTLSSACPWPPTLIIFPCSQHQGKYNANNTENEA